MTERKTKYRNASIAVAGTLTLVYFLIGYFDSNFYRFELLLIPIVYMVGASVAMLLTYLIVKLENRFTTTFMVLLIVSFTFLIVENFVQSYKPTLVINIPENYNGMVHLFPSNVKYTEVMVTEKGIGYVPNKGEYENKIYHGSRVITDALNEYGRAELLFYNADSTKYQSISLTCFTVELNRVYPTSPWNQKHAKCMTKQQYIESVQAGIIDSSLIVKQTWKVQSNY